jgi:phosphoribosylanthranilate isomerase
MMHSVSVKRRGDVVVFDFHANAFLHHMIRNLVGSLVYRGQGALSGGWMAELLAARKRSLAAPTFAPDGLYLCGVEYPERWPLPGGGRIIAPPQLLASVIAVHRTRIKICGLTREDDVRAAVNAGADAIGFVFYPPSPRYVTLRACRRAGSPAAALRDDAVGLFVNPSREEVGRCWTRCLCNYCSFTATSGTRLSRYGLPYIKAARMRQGLDLLKYAASFASAQGLLLDAFVEGYGGGGETFDWSLIPSVLPLPLILSGGLHAGNVAEAVQACPALGGGRVQRR